MLLAEPTLLLLALEAQGRLVPANQAVLEHLAATLHLTELHL